jgi:hypothetical protein
MLANRSIIRSMRDLCRLIWCALVGLFRSRAALEAEILLLRHQLNILQRSCPKRASLGRVGRLLLVALYLLSEWLRPLFSVVSIF